ncbi:hypothetical protein TYRP_004514 [Tyrophagus putrescentiae]|nr:hypothetical protein TYRP_004514 [Tyrophagus putrescentiae]
MDGRSQSTGSRSASAVRADVFDVQTVSIVVAVAVILISIILYLLGRRNTRTSILLVGLSDAGKTALFTQLAHNTFTETVTSMKENEEEIRTNGSRRLVSLIDVPWL